ncbi:phosphoribosyltransferase-like protein [Enterobacter roggenkampii]
MCLNVITDDDLKISIAATLSDYRHVPPNGMNSEHVSRWVNQFPQADVRFILEETDRILKLGYIKREDYDRVIIENANAQENRELLETAAFLDIQDEGFSQQEIIQGLYDHCPEEINVVTRRSSQRYVNSFDTFVYFDDVCFSGLKASEDLVWLIVNYNLQNVCIIVYFMGSHSSATWQIQQKIEKAFPDRGITLRIGHGELRHLENRLSYNARSEVLWPDVANAIIPPGTRNPENYNGTCRNGFIINDVFPDERRRNRLEAIFTEAGFAILSHSDEPKKGLKPLGFSPFPGLGFGGTMFTFRNCPNNVPLAFWWGNYERAGGPALACWYPLMKRIVYNR